MQHRRHGPVVALGTALVSLLVAGCAATDTSARSPVDMTDDLVGTFEGPDGAFEVRIAADDTFTATGVPDRLSETAGGSASVDAEGHWEVLGGTLFLHVEDAESGEQRSIILVDIVGADELSIQDDGDEIGLVRVE